jgi:sRNA-binding carbon storage regulator CsrA
MDGPLPGLMNCVDPGGQFGQMVLTRNTDECIVVSRVDDGSVLVVISVNEIQATRVRLGCHAPGDISIDRESVYLLKQIDRVESLIEKTNAFVSPEDIKKIEEFKSWLNKFKPQQ